MFKNVIVRRPSKAIVNGITSAPELGKPDYELALKQHDDYIEALKSCGVNVEVLDADDEYPDSCFVEDTAVLTSNVAIISNPARDSRNGEAMRMLPTIQKYYAEDKIEYIKSPGTLEGGDIMMVGNHFYVGKSDRTNTEGANQFIAILEKYGHTGSIVTLDEMLHLKTGVNYIENNNMLVFGEFIDKEEFSKYNKLLIHEDEAYSANCIWMNDKVIVPEGYPHTKTMIEKSGYEVIEVDTSEYKKIDGGLSCLSLRF